MNIKNNNSCQFNAERKIETANKYEVLLLRLTIRYAPMGSHVRSTLLEIQPIPVVPYRSVCTDETILSG